jgi:hypothetical protein
VLRAGRILAVTEGLNSNTVSGRALNLTKTNDLWAKPYFVCSNESPEGELKPGCLRETDQDKQAEILVATLLRPHSTCLRSAHLLARQAGVGNPTIDRLWGADAPKPLLMVGYSYKTFLRDETSR